MQQVEIFRARLKNRIGKVGCCSKGHMQIYFSCDIPRSLAISISRCAKETSFDGTDFAVEEINRDLGLFYLMDGRTTFYSL